jgi:integrase
MINELRIRADRIQQAGDILDLGSVILKAKKIRPRPFYNTRHSYVSFLYSIGARSGFISSQTGDSIKTLETYYAKYIKRPMTTAILSSLRSKKVQP